MVGFGTPLRHAGCFYPLSIHATTHKQPNRSAISRIPVRLFVRILRAVYQQVVLIIPLPELSFSPVLAKENSMQSVSFACFSVAMAVSL